ncbi:NAD(P)H-hydrate epimerase [Caenorhabditis elegans]|uniref:NAD(P)H-hydrate epimerase n=1 Tax=Caenorhabditis elegans TaxID=6239 RepID=NNRE_CAEEL|nr:NAD(P)H-hydrate epimerase [Caenorhabditis elegans]Q9XW15.2 RecName: Full=NAD(P)H-hydrate epimerase; AltName: Full=NAD(P)HX epimerase [Caenorhabditis elegans]CAA22319.2 NAD(P)H-hydrate epimerase [Caenorhabditis elegans]
MVHIISKKTVSFIGQKLAAQIDEQLFTKYGFKVEQLMELAGLAAAQAIAAHYPKSNVAVLCGPGNNGGDGFVCARHLQQFGFTPSIVYPKESRNELMKSLVVQCETSSIPITATLPTNLQAFPLIVDALFGFSFHPPTREPFTEMLKTVRASGIHVFSIDVPSGWDVELGAPSGNDDDVIHPHSVISLTLPKLCMKNWTGPHFLGGRFVPKSLVDEHELLMPQYPGFEQIVKLED